MKLFYNYQDIMNILNFSDSKAYEIIRQINAKLRNQGVRTEKGRVLVRAFEEEYGIERDDKNVRKNQINTTNCSVSSYDARG